MTRKIRKTGNPDSAGLSADYTGLLVSIKERIRSVQYEVLRTVNRKLVGEIAWAHNLTMFHHCPQKMCVALLEGIDV